ncbi:MAG: hypothetical protein WCV73_03900 [Patescibacteria group bacterium]|jgi:hypothetical protein
MIDQLSGKFEFDEENNELQSPLTDDIYQEPVGSKSQKTEIKPGFIVGALALLTITGLFFTITSWFNALKIPFIARNNTALENVNNDLNLTNSDVANLLEAKQKDTDSDGLNDYDELYVYKTSPYIPDSDSDGNTDGAEVKNGTNPNCPIGQDCAQNSLVTTPALSNLPTSMDNLTPDQIRSILLSAGVAEADLKNVDDTALQQMYQEVLQESAKQNTNSDTTGLTELQPADYEAITPDQLRALLIDQGASAEDVKDLSDTDLQALWNQVLTEAQSNSN